MLVLFEDGIQRTASVTKAHQVLTFETPQKVKGTVFIINNSKFSEKRCSGTLSLFSPQHRLSHLIGTNVTTNTDTLNPLIHLYTSKSVSKHFSTQKEKTTTC